MRGLLHGGGFRASGFRDLFGIDTRSLAVLRVSLALIILADLAIRATELDAFYTEDGVLPRALLRDQVAARAPGLAPVLDLVPHVVFDAAFGQALLFAVAGLVAVLLLVGWRTRWATIASWVLLMSLHARNPALRNAGDDIFRLLLFWSMFLPLGASWSLDARRRGPSPPRLVTGGAPAPSCCRSRSSMCSTRSTRTGRPGRPISRLSSGFSPTACGAPRRDVTCWSIPACCRR